MKQFSLFEPAETASAQFAKPSNRSHSQAQAALRKASLPTAQAPVRPKPKPQSRLPISTTPYGRGHRSDGPLSISGLDHSYCNACGWISRPQHHWAGGES